MISLCTVSIVIWISKSHSWPPRSSRRSWSSARAGDGEAISRTRETLRFGDFKVSFKMVQNIFLDNVQDVSKSLVTFDPDSGIKNKLMYGDN